MLLFTPRALPDIDVVVIPLVGSIYLGTVHLRISMYLFAAALICIAPQ